MMQSLGADILPRVGCLTPAKIFNKVLLPAPFFPIRAMRSFSLITNDMSLNKVVPPNSTASPSMEIIASSFEIGCKDSVNRIENKNKLFVFCMEGLSAFASCEIKACG